MARFLKNRHAAYGGVPGSLVFIGSPQVAQPFIQKLVYSKDAFDEQGAVDVKSLEKPEIPGQTLWLNVVGLHDTDMIREVGEVFALHDLLLENVVNTGQRPRMEEFGDALFFTLKMLRYDDNKQVIVAEQLSVVLKENLVITFQEAEGDVFEPVRERIRKNRGRVRKVAADYLAFALLDVVFDQYIAVVESIGEEIEELESEVLANPSPELLETINQFKMEINYLRKHIRPAREMASQFAKTDSSLVRKGTIQFLKELVANAAQAAEVVDSYGSLLGDFLQVYHTAVSNKLNEVMKILTIFAAIFIPLTFLAGIYGTNFEFPEKDWKYSYYVFWGVLLVVGFLMLRYFRKKKWL